MHSIVNCPAAHSVKNKAARQVPLYGGVPRSGGVVRERKKVPHPCHCEPSQMAWQSLFCCCVARALMRGHITFTGSPRSHCSLAMTRNEHAFPPVIASAAKQSSKLCPHANACDFICTLNSALCKKRGVAPFFISQTNNPFLNGLDYMFHL